MPFIPLKCPRCRKGMGVLRFAQEVHKKLKKCKRCLDEYLVDALPENVGDRRIWGVTYFLKKSKFPPLPEWREKKPHLPQISDEELERMANQKFED